MSLATATLVALGLCSLTFVPADRFIWVVLAIGIAPLVRSLSGCAKDILRPSVLIPLVYALYAVGPVLVDMGYAQETISLYGIVHLVGIVSLMIGLRLGENRAVALPRIAEFGPGDLAALRLTIVVLLGLGAVGIATQVMAFGGLGGLLAVGYGGRRFQVLRAAHTFGAGFDWWLLACCLLWFMALETKRKSLMLLGAILALPVLLMVIRIGGRSTLVYAAIFVFVLFHEGRRRAGPWVVIVGLVVGVFLAQFYSLARFFLADGLWAAVRETSMIAGRSPWALLPTASNEFRAPSAALLDVLQFAPSDRWFGRSYLEAVATTVPGLANALGLHGPSPSTWRLQEFHPEILAGGGGLGFSPAAEGWLNFGAVGVIAHLLAYGLVIGGIFRAYRARPGIAALLFLAGAMPMFALDGLRIHSAAFLYKTTRVYLLPLVVFVMTRDLVRMARSSEKTCGRKGS